MGLVFGFFFLDMELKSWLYKWMNRVKMVIWEIRNSSGFIFFGSIIVLKWKIFKE